MSIEQVEQWLRSSSK